LRCKRGAGFLQGESEEGGSLELWLSLFKQASSSVIRFCNCSTKARSAAFSAGIE